MRKRAARWVIEVTRAGSVNLLRGGRPLQQGIPMATATRYIERHRTPGDRVFRQDEDGYATEITRTL